MQMSWLLAQQEFEGQRPPMMPSDDFVDGSFLSGIPRQEYFFHCITSREGFVVKYDLSVHDSDGSVAQLQYGEDGLAVEKCTYFKETYDPFLVASQSSILQEDEYSRIVQMSHSTNDIFIRKTLKTIQALIKETRDLAPTDDYNDTTRFKISDETKIRMTPFINHYRFFDPHT